MQTRLTRCVPLLVAAVACTPAPGSGFVELGPAPDSPGSTGGDGSDDGRPDGAGGADDGPDCTRPSAGRTPLRILTRHQYGSMLESVFPELQLSGDQLVAELPPDVAAAGFLNNVGALVDDTRLSQLYAVASGVASRAVGSLAELEGCSPGRACAEKVVARRARRAYRHSLDEAQEDELLALFDAAPNARAGMVRLMTAMLLSADALYHFDSLAPEGQLSSRDTASKLSFALWDSVPDDVLLTAADEDALRTDEEVAQAFDRMLRDRRTAGVIARFHGEWLALDATTTKDEALFPGFSAQTYAEALEESRRFADHVVRESRGTFADLLSSRVAFPTPALARVYGLADSDAPPFSQAELDVATRRGLLTRVAFLADTAGESRTSVTERGVVIRRKVLCESIPEPGADIQNQFPLLPDDPSLSARDIVAIHLENPSCAGCHTLMDPIGLLFEHYDPVGTFRARNGDGSEIDARGEVVRGSSGPSDAEGMYADALALSEGLAKSETALACYADHWFRFVLGRVADEGDACAYRALRSAFVAGDQPIASLLRAIVLSPSFRLPPAPESRGVEP